MGVLEDKTRARYFYKYLSKVYDRVNAFVFTEPMRAEALSLLDLEPTDRVIDVGCGTGFGTEGLKQTTDHILGVDQSPHQMAKARERLDERELLGFTMGDAENLPVRSNTFDHAWSSGSIEYWPNPVQGLAEMRRVVKPGGRVVVVGPYYPDSWIGRRIVDAIMLFYDEAEAEEMFQAAGFEDTRHEVVGSKYKSNLAIVSVGVVPEN
ncbi:methyltransferase domain-containing protein [Halodesulfurarchaeum sp. HSR-GB]|uniref:methyltransferase domain-containing protein n=1 Tax=Halodesulfurarchaeum sp. HSR-GB TaxID=3074077 RepID=UPI002859D697|nr:methyltransferase domain-containing protein [Halodesulfurarchaeum sp. HSR-GB]MDR5656407.1 methyltransferase domain-containing protein [Halodesulfurarchaeum sp. HSR-GB]